MNGNALSSPIKFGLFFMPAKNQDFESFLSQAGFLAVYCMEIIPPNAVFLKDIEIAEVEDGLAVFLNNQFNTFHNVRKEVPQ